MRPLRLVLNGFRSHVEETTFDFVGRTLLAIVGPTGAGKSTILDGISYALYAKTPREKKNSKNLVSTRVKKAAITYRFALGDETYEINRSIPAASDDHMVHVENGDKAVGSTAITAKVEELLGLDFDGFASSVLLAQGRFDLFLKATTKERTGILKGIFRIERIDELRKAAVGRRAGIDLELATIEGEFKQIPEDAAELVKTARSKLKELATQIGVLEKALPEEAALVEREKDAAKEKAEAETGIVTLTDAVKRLPRTDALEELATREKDCAAVTKEATSTFESCRKAADKATKDLEALQKKLGDVKELHAARAKAEGIAARTSEIAELEAQLKDVTAAIDAAKGKVDEAVAAESAAKANLNEARAQLVDLNRLHAAHALRSTLAKGEPCPVCEQAVATLPKSKKVGDVTKAEATVEKAEAALSHAQTVVVAAKNTAATEAQRARSLIEAHEKATAARADALDAVAALVGTAKDPVAAIDERLTQLEDALAARDAARESRDRAQQALNECAAVKHDLDKERQQHAGVLIELAVRLDVPPPTLDDGATALIAKVETMAGRAAERGEELNARREKAELVVTEVAGSLAELRARAGVDTSLSDALSKAKSDEAVTQHVIADLTEKIARTKELQENQKDLTARRALFHQLADDLTDSRFVNFLLEDRRRLLSELASERLREMTKRYRFTDDGNFNIVDELEGDVERGSDTLSGGETFLASLALALGLAETATRHGGRLQSFFLDEGFDALDAEMLDLSLDGIERIVTPERLIALVSHVPALAARVEDKIVLSKDPDGHTIVVSGASA